MKKFNSLVELLRHRSQEQPEDLAFSFLQNGEEQTAYLSYKMLDRKAKSIAAALQSMGLEKERVAIIYSSGLEFISAFFGCLYAGAIAVPAYPPRRNQNLSRLLTIISDAQIKVVLASDNLWSEIASEIQKVSGNHQVRCLSIEGLTEDLEDQWQETRIGLDTVAFLQYTSGSTSLPKGVMVSHGNVLHNEQMIKDAFGHTEQTTVVGWLPFHHDMGLIGNLLQSVYLGCPYIFMPPWAFLQKPMRWLQLISRYKSVSSGGPNFAYELCLNSINQEEYPKLDLSSWAIAFNGSEPINAETLEKFAIQFKPYGFRSEVFFPCYGMAENTLFVSGSKGSKENPLKIHQIEADNLKINQVTFIESAGVNKRNQKIVSCGQPQPDQKVIIVDPQTHLQCAENQVGEIWLSGASVALGYWKKTIETEEAFRAYLADTKDGPFLRTGDLGFLHEQELFITGRCKDIVIIRGENHYPQDLELTISKSHAAFQAASGAVFTVEVNGFEQLVIVQEVNRHHMRSLVAEELFKKIRRVVSEEHGLCAYSISLIKPFSIPKTTSGKIRRGVCRENFLNNQLQLIQQWVAQLDELENEQLQSEVATFSERLQNNLLDNSSPKEINKMQVIQDWLVVNLAKNLKIPPQHIDPEEAFSEYGLDSSLAVSLTDALATYLGRELEATLFWDFPSIKSLAEHLTHH